jgi:hypothetical protein
MLHRSFRNHQNNFRALAFSTKLCLSIIDVETNF